MGIDRFFFQGAHSLLLHGAPRIVGLILAIS
jgi:hypothetical protein